MQIKACWVLLAALFLGAQPVRAEDYILTLKDHAYTPKEITIPADQKVKLIVKNASPVAAEFESSDLNREKIVTAGNEVTIFVGPLKAGAYQFFDDFHRETTGMLIAK